MPDKNVDLIFSVAELARLFEHSDDLKQFLHRVVTTIAEHLQAGVCSVYLYDRSQEVLVLKATVGLAEDSVDNVKLKIGEGITGLAVQEMRAVREDEGQENPSFKFFKGINEELYPAFLAVPILRNTRAIGALTVQHEERGFFREEDNKTLLAIAAQLASTIENTSLLMKFGGRTHAEELSQDREEAIPGFLKGKSASSGVARGYAAVLAGNEDDYLHELVRTAEGRDYSSEDVENAFRLTQNQLEELEHMLEERLGDTSAALLFSSQQLMLTDEGFSGYIRGSIEQGAAAVDATMEAVEKYVDIFSHSENPLLREKVQDIRDLAYRFLRNLVAESPDVKDYSDRIVIGNDLLPTDILKLATQGVTGIVLLSGNVTAHVAVLAQSLGLPVVIGGDKRLLSLPSGTDMLIDAIEGNIFIEPDEEVLERYAYLLEKDTGDAELAAQDISPETWSADGERIYMMANINLCSDLQVAKQQKAEGVGLYRSEFPFIIRNDFPSEEEQLSVYQRVLGEMEGQKVIFRTLDIGGDKVVSYMPNKEENNPFMGLRAIRFSLKNKEIFSEQLRALLRAADGRSLYVMFPMIASVDDFIESRALLYSCKKALEDEGIEGCPEEVHAGLMVELPSAVNLIQELAAEADFMSIGSNDLIQYLLGVDRTNRDIADFYKPFHPAVLRALQQITNAAAEGNTSLSICGEIATDQRMIPFLLGIGIRQFSMDARQIPRIQKLIGEISIDEAERVASNMLACRRITEVEELLERA